MPERGRPIALFVVALAALRSVAVATEAEVPGAWREEGSESHRSLILDDMNASGPLTEEELAAAVPEAPPAPARNASELGNLSGPALSSALRCSRPIGITSFAYWPQKAIGKVIYKRAGTSHWCSGAFLGSYSTVLTAGHCCHSDDGWHRDWEVWLHYRYEDGVRYGTRYRARRASVPTAWYRQYKNWAYDWCFLTMHEEGPAYLGYWANFPAAKLSRFWAYGYPSNYGDGLALQADPGEVGALEKKDTGAGILQGRCVLMKQGCSGGPWYTFRHRYAFGLNSFHLRGELNDEYSPYFGDAWLRTCRYVGACRRGRRLRGSDGSTSPGGSSAPLLA